MGDFQKQRDDTNPGRTLASNDKGESHATLSHGPVPLSIRELQVDASAPFDIPYPTLDAGHAICIGLTIDWRQRQSLYAAALRYTVVDEHTRAARYLRPEDSLRHLLGRALLRRVAACYGGADASEPIGTNEWGKPLVAASRIGCNISHAGTQVWVAVSPYARVGIDVESEGGLPDFHDIAASFHPAETAALHETGNAGNAAIRCWSRKEAVAKAIGMGLSLPLDAFAVDCSATAANWLRIAPPTTSLHDWTTMDLPAGNNYVGALAIEGRCEHVTVLRLLSGAHI